jgi:hypothetical protein
MEEFRGFSESERKVLRRWAKSLKEREKNLSYIG